MFLVDARKKVPKNFNLYCWSDQHEGAVGQMEDKVLICRDIIARDEKAWWVNIGDPCEAIHLGDRRYGELQKKGKKQTVDAQIESIVDIVKPIAPRCLAWADGNHDLILESITNVSLRICKDLYKETGASIPFGGISARIQISDTAIVGIYHPFKNIRKPKAGEPQQRKANEQVQVARLLREGFPAGDCILTVMGHIHRLVISPPSEMPTTGGGLNFKMIYPKLVRDPKTGWLPEECKWYCSTGGFVKRNIISKKFDEKFDMGKCIESKKYPESATTYVEKAAYGLAETGMIKAVIRGGMVVDVEKVIV